MATSYLRTDPVPVILPNHFAQAAAVLASFDRAAIGGAIEVLVGLLDVLDGDADANDTDDSEDSFAFTGLANAHRKIGGPGCDIADAGGGEANEDDPQGWLAQRWDFIDQAGPGCVISDPDCAVDDTGCDGDEGV